MAKHLFTSEDVYKRQGIPECPGSGCGGSEEADGRAEGVQQGTEALSLIHI